MNGYTPQVGDRVKRETWTRGYADVDYVGSSYLVGRNSSGEEMSWAHLNDCKWVKVEMPNPLPDRWINVYPSGYTGWSKTREQADEEARCALDRLAVLHMWTDDHEVDHIEIERIKQ